MATPAMSTTGDGQGTGSGAGHRRPAQHYWLGLEEIYLLAAAIFCWVLALAAM